MALRYTLACACGVVLALLPRTTLAVETINWTFYAPGASGWMQGPMTAASPDASGRSNVIHTLDDVRRGVSSYVTLASATVMRGRWYCIGEVTFTSPTTNGGDGMTHTLQHVVGYVHDTGCAFNGTCSCGRLAAFCNGVAHPEKMDIPVGNFNGWGDGQAANYITKNPNSAARTWQQIAGPPTGTSGTSNDSACGGVPRETGVPTAASYRPTSILDQPPPGTNGLGNPFINSASPYGSAAPPPPNYFPTSPQSGILAPPTQATANYSPANPQSGVFSSTTQVPATQTNTLSTVPNVLTGGVKATSSATTGTTATNPLVDLLTVIANQPPATSTTIGTGTPITLTAGARDIAQLEATSETVRTVADSTSTAPTNFSTFVGKQTFTSSDIGQSSYSPRSTSALMQILQNIKIFLLNLLNFLNPSHSS